MEARQQSTKGVWALVLALMAFGVGAVAWSLPARWAAVTPAVLRAQGTGTPGMVEVASGWVAGGKPGPAAWMLAASIRAGMMGTNELSARLTGSLITQPGYRVLGGGDALLSRVTGLRVPMVTNAMLAAFDLFLPTTNRALLREFLSSSRSPVTQGLLRARGFAPRQFVAADRAGGQPLDAVLLMAATLGESESYHPDFGRELGVLAAAVVAGQPADELEGVLLDLLMVGRRLDWTSMRELLRVMPDREALRQWTTAVRGSPEELAELFSAAVLSQRPVGIARRWSDPKEREGLRVALTGGSGSVRAFADGKLPVRAAKWSLDEAAPWVARMGWLGAAARTGLMWVAGLLAAAALRLLLWDPHGRNRRGGSGWGGSLTLACSIALFLNLASEPIPSRNPIQNQPRVRLLSGAEPVTPPISKSSKKGPIMEAKTIATIVLFALIQATVYIICRRKISEIRSMAEPPALRLRLMENEENLFDAGLYVGIAGTAAALVLQVLQLVEANLLAAYSSNLMGIVTVALIKIRHVRPIKRELILEGSTGSRDVAVGTVAVSEEI
jgi:hypothetical protein